MAGLNVEKGPLFKVILLGEAGVGKTAIFHRAKENSFSDCRKSTVGIDSLSLYVKVGDQQVTVSENRKVYLPTWQDRNGICDLEFFIFILHAILFSSLLDQQLWDNFFSRSLSLLISGKCISS